MFAVPASASVTVPYFIDQVFDVVAHPRVALKVDELGNERATAGSAFSVASKIAWIDYMMTIAVIDYERPYRITYRLSSKERAGRRQESPPIDAVYKLRTVPQGTLVRFTQRNGFRHPLVLPVAIILWPLALFGARKEVHRLNSRIKAEIDR